jgi:hypothetical protein
MKKADSDVQFIGAFDELIRATVHLDSRMTGPPGSAQIIQFVILATPAQQAHRFAT